MAWCKVAFTISPCGQFRRMLLVDQRSGMIDCVSSPRTKISQISPLRSCFHILFIDPESITRINATSRSHREITLQWDRPEGDFDTFEVQYIDADENYIENLTLLSTMTISGLRPFRNYTFTVIVRSGSDATVLRKSTPLSAVFSTKEYVPGKVIYFRPIDVEPNNITFQWSLPQHDYNGVLLYYVIKYGMRVSIENL